MDYGPQTRTIEEQEIIEHYITESRRTVPFTSTDSALDRELITETTERRFEERLPYPPYPRASENLLQQQQQQQQQQQTSSFGGIAGSDSDRRFVFKRTHSA
ncbi:unnamed protein product [Anisakis simplex]|uniref:Uncharacterized protein n=1 Tax=Anisakis simplex TaxID=6269 RepID=A0A0M3K2P8_ANISI|nr:unnamed protein product [Anisakis simplex]